MSVEEIVEAVRVAASSKTPLAITGGGSKAHLGDAVEGRALTMDSYNGVISYEPTELVVTVRSGTSMDSLTQTLSGEGQCLPFEPPLLKGSTIGGVLACGLSGPARPFTGSARDYVLGMRLINGQAEDLSFGGEVMKNVAGYDVARLQVGAYGTLGVLLETSLKVLPIPEATLTVQREACSTDSLAELIELSRQPWPITGLFRQDKVDTIRLSGSESAVRSAAKSIGGQSIEGGDELWAELRDQSSEFFTHSSESLWRLSVPAHARMANLPGEVLYDWGGAQRWLRTSAPAQEIFSEAKALGGHAICYSAVTCENAGFQPLEPGIARLHARLRDSFDPHRLFNRGRFQPDVDS